MMDLDMETQAAKRICILDNPIMDYAWGSQTAIPELLGRPSSADTPQAELWMGAHPKAPSSVTLDNEVVLLPDLVAQHTQDVLGKYTTGRFGKLPFLFKILAAAQPLSIQAHPNQAQAEQGFARENAQGIPLDGRTRNYRDNSHKPEIICALTDFWALNRFRRISEILALMEAMGLAGISKEVSDFHKSPNQEGLKTFFRALLTLDHEQKKRVIEEAVSYARTHQDQDPVWDWMLKIYAHYPDDMGVLSPVLLNLVKLAPGQAMFLGAGELHAYLEGVGVELMANSDNVLRGGLTPKHMDVDELLTTLTFIDSPLDVLSGEKGPGGERIYKTPAKEFSLAAIQVDNEAGFISTEDRSVEILICVQGEALVTDTTTGDVCKVAKGTSFLVPAALGCYRIDGEAAFYRASVPKHAG